VNIGPGTFTETVTPIEFNANLHFVCAASGDNAEGVNFASVIKLGNSRNTALFSFTSAYFMANGYAHFLQMENCTLDGNATNNASAPSLVKQWNGGYQNTYRHVQFQNCKNFCLELDNQVVNFSCYSCTFGGQNGGAVFLNDLVGANVMLMVDTQIDNSGVNPIQIVQDTGDTGGSNIATFINTKFEATSGSTNHQHVIDFTPRSSGGHPFNLIVNGLTAINTIGSGTYALYEEAGGGTLANWEITGVNVGGYTAAFKNNQSGEVSNNGEIKHLINSDKVNTSDDAPELQLSGGPGIYTGSGTPEGSKAGCIGSIYMRIDGGTNTTLYKKESGACTVNTGWAAAGAGGGGSGVSVFTGSTGATNACGATPTISLADVGGKSTTVIGCTLSVNITSVTFASVPSGGGAIFYINFIQPTMGPTYTVAFGGSAVATCDSSIILANGITTTQGMQVMPDGTIRGTGCTNDLTGESDTGPEMACPTTTISGQGFWCFDSAAHTLVYFGNASPNRHAMPRVASGDQMAATDLSNGALGTGRVCLETMGCMSGGGGSFSSTTGNTLVTQTGSAIPLMEVTGVPAMAAGGSSGNCMNMEMGIDTNTGTAAGNILFYVDATLVFQVQTISAAAGYAYQRTFTYCNNAGVTNAQTITMKAPAGYCTTLASCASWATDNTGQFAIHPTVSNNIAMGSGTHTFSIYTTGTAGQAYTGNFLSVRQ
jgi:hypothetical protein